MSTPAFLLLAAVSTAFTLAPSTDQAVQAVAANEHAPTALPWSDAVQVRSFDPDRGALAAVRVSIDAFVRADLAAENLDAAPALIRAHALALVGVQLPNGQTIAQMPFETDAQWATTAFDGSVDFAGTSGRRTANVARRHVEVVIDDPALLLYFVGVPGGGGVVELPASAFGSSSIVGGGSLAENTTMDAGVRVTVRYVVAPPATP